jgi:hypothetical protein
MIIVHEVADVIFADWIRGLDGKRGNVTIMFQAIIDYILGAVVAGTFIVAVFSKIMVEADAVGQAVLVYEVHKLIHGLCPNDFYVSAYR